MLTTDTKFTIDEKGNVTTTGTISEDGVLLVEDAMTKVSVSKTDIADGEELEGPHQQCAGLRQPLPGVLLQVPEELYQQEHQLQADGPEDDGDLRADGVKELWNTGMR